MARVTRADVFAPDEIAIVHCIARVVRRCFLLGNDPVSGKNFDHRKQWVEDLLERFASCFAIDLIAYAILSNHFHLVLRSRPDIVATWSDEEVARRWLLICPKRKKLDGSPEEPKENEIRSIVKNQKRLQKLRSRLSDLSWWLRLLCQRIGMRANREDGEVGKFFQGRFKAVRLLDEESVLACAAYVDLNLIRAAMAETIEQSSYTSVKKRVEAMVASRSNADHGRSVRGASPPKQADAFLSPVFCEATTTGPMASQSIARASDKGFTWMSARDYLEFLDALARSARADKRGSTPVDVPPIFARLQLDVERWTDLIANFGQMFSGVAGKAETIYEYRGKATGKRFRLKSRFQRETIAV
jgi:hypothetical protein